MNLMRELRIPVLAAGLLVLAALPAWPAVNVQCPGDINGDGVPDQVVLDANGDPRPIKCRHLGAGDGFVTMADGQLQYMFGFSDLTGIPDNPATPHDDRMAAGMLAGNFPAPLIVLDEGDEFHLSLTNVGMMMRPDLFDPHTVHWHGFPQAAPIFDGMPDGSISINMGSTVTYYYKVMDPGTYFYHCHVEALEHMQMGMLGNLYVRPRQNRLADGTTLSGFIHRTGFQYAYNDGDGSTYYDVDYPIQLSGFDHNFHNASESVQPLPFAAMSDTYAMLNGRGFPDTVNPDALAPPAENGGVVSQPLSSRIEAAAGQKILLRLSNVSVTKFYTLGSLGIPMRVVGKDARLLRGPDGKDLSYTTGSITLGGGEAADVILDTTGVPAGTYYLYTTNLNYLSNNQDDFGGMMTAVVIRPAL